MSQYVIANQSNDGYLILSHKNNYLNPIEFTLTTNLQEATIISSAEKNTSDDYIGFWAMRKGFNNIKWVLVNIVLTQ